MMGGMTFEVEIRDDSIKLGQFLKLANLAETGGEAKNLIAEGRIRVNGEVDTRRGKVLRDGDVVMAPAGEAVLVTNVADDDDTGFDPSKWENL